jgi:hypothetical protein
MKLRAHGGVKSLAMSRVSCNPVEGAHKPDSTGEAIE